MPSKLSLRAIRTHFKSKPDERYVTHTEDFPGLQPNANLANNVNPRPNIPRKPVSPQAVSPMGAAVAPYSPQHVGAPQSWPSPDGSGVAELDANRSVHAVERDQYLQRENLRRQEAERAHWENLQRAKEESRWLAEQKQEAELRKQMLERQQNASKDTVRRLRELIRERYRLDIYIWSKRKVKRANRKIIEAKCEKSDAILQEIYFIVEAWEEDLFEPEDWKVARKIKESILQKDQHPIWGDIPPWDRGEDGEPTRRQS